MENRIKSAIIKAQKLIKEMEFDSEYQKNIVFSEAIKYFLYIKNNTLGVDDNINEKGNNTNQNFDFWALLNRATNVDEKNLKDIYALNQDQIQLVMPRIEGKTTAEQCSFLAVVVSFAYHEGKKLEWVPTRYLVEAARHLNLDTTNFNRDLGNTGLFRKKGKKKGVEYRLSAQGFVEARSYIDRLSNFNK